MDTDEEYLDAVLRWNPSMRTLAGTDIPIDGLVEFRYPRYQEDQPDRFDLDESGHFWRLTFPYRSVEKDDEPWFGNPNGGEWSRRPIWKWQNPNDPLDEMTLSPSIGKQSDGEMDFHCYVRNGEIEWL
jgi:hypothetical protein